MIRGIKCLAEIDPGHRETAFVVGGILGNTTINQEILPAALHGPFRSALLVYLIEYRAHSPQHPSIQNSCEELVAGVEASNWSVIRRAGQVSLLWDEHGSPFDKPLRWTLPPIQP